MKRKLLIAFAVAGLLTAAGGPSTLPAGAAAHIITIKLLSGQLLTYQLADGALAVTARLAAFGLIVGAAFLTPVPTPAEP